MNHRYVQIIITHLYSLKLIMMSRPKQHKKIEISKRYHNRLVNRTEFMRCNHDLHSRSSTQIGNRIFKFVIL